MSIAVVNGNQSASGRTLSTDPLCFTKRIVRVLLALYILMSAAFCFTGSSIFKPISSQKANDASSLEAAIPVQNRVTRLYRLYNRCSGRYIQMYFKDVNARGKPNSPLAQLRIESDCYGGRVRIQSEKFGKYLCFNRKYRPTNRYNGKKEQCVFVEHISENFYTELESAWHKGFYLGFNSKGRFLAPSERERSPQCFQFIKVEDLNRVEQFRGEQYGPVAVNKPRKKWKKDVLKQHRRAIIFNSTNKPNLFHIE